MLSTIIKCMAFHTLCISSTMDVDSKSQHLSHYLYIAAN